MLWFFTAGSVQYLLLLTLQKKKQLEKPMHSNDELCLYRETKGRQGSSWLPICTTARYQLGNLHHICHQNNRILCVKLKQLQWLVFQIRKCEIIFLLCVHRADQALTTLAMRKFCEDKVSSSLQPSQNRFDSLSFALECCASRSSHPIMFAHLSSSGTSTTLVVCSLVPSK